MRQNKAIAFFLVRLSGYKTDVNISLMNVRILLNY